MTEPDTRSTISAMSPEPSPMPTSQGPKRRRLMPWLLAGAASLVLVGGLGLTKYNQVMAGIAYGQSFPEPAEAVLVAVAERLNQAPATSTTGELQAVDLVELRVERSGVVAGLNFRSGDVVDRGQTLVRIDTSEERGDLAAAEIEARRARTDATRSAGLFAQGAAAKVSAEQADSAAASAEARVAALQTEIDRKTIRAPFAGRVGITDLKPGQYVAEGALVARLVGLRSGMYVDFTLPQEAVASIDLKQPVRVSSGAFNAKARIIASEPGIDVATRSLGYRALIENYTGALPAGSLVTVSVDTGAARDVVAIPRTAVMRSPYGNTVYALVEAEGQTRARAILVELGPAFGDNNVVVLSGLAPGVRIAADGVFKLRDGGLVRPVSSADEAKGDKTTTAPSAGDGK